MKVLFNKIKRANKIALTFYIITNLCFLIGFIFLTKSFLYLKGIETAIRVIILILLFLWFLTYFLFGLSTMLVKKFKKFIALTVINVLLIIIMFAVSLVIHTLYQKIDMLSTQEYTEYTTNLIALSDTELKNSDKIGMIKNKDDIEGYVLANTLKNKEKLKQEIVYYDDYYSMLDALYTKEIAAIFVSSNYTILFSSEDAYANIATETKILYTYTEKMKTKTITNTNKKLTEPFTMLLMGVDSEIDGMSTNAAFNGDTLMLITFNPKTLAATILSIPRDTYVPIACNNDRYNKINSAAAYGTECVINTIQNMVGITIDYYAKINFNGAIDLVNALDGIDVNVEAPDYKYYINTYGEGVLCESNSLRDMTNLVCMNTGMQHLTGEQALAYARNRHGFLESDLARNRHQQQIIEAIATKMFQKTSFADFEKILDAIGKNIATNLTTNQLLSFYQTLKDMLINGLKGNEFIKIQKTYLEVYNLPITIGGMNVSALGYYEGSLQAITDAMNINLGNKNEQMIKTFTYDYNEIYTTNVIGKGITSGGKLETVPNFIGSTVNVAEEWALNNDITLNKEFTACTNGIPGIITNQSVAIGTLAKSITSLTVYISESCPTTTPDSPDDNNESSNNNDSNTTPNETPDNTDITDIIPGLTDNPISNSDTEQNINTENTDE